jgi:CRP-like cAMP-binding protein
MVNTRFDGGGILARKLNTFLPLTPDELKCLDEIQSQPFPVKRGRQLTQEGHTGHRAFLLQAGWACSYKVLRDGARQIISFPIAGDIVGLRSVLLRTADHSFSALTDAVVSPVDGTHVMKCVTEFPRLGAALCGLRPVTKRWLSSTLSTLGGAMPSSVQLIFSWSWSRG